MVLYKLYYNLYQIAFYKPTFLIKKLKYDFVYQYHLYLQIDMSSTEPTISVVGRKVIIATTFSQKIADFLNIMAAYTIIGVSPGKISELQTNNPEELLDDKTDKAIKNLGHQDEPIVVEDTSLSFLKSDGTSTHYPGFDVTRVVKLYDLYDLAKDKSFTRAEYCCSAKLVMPDGKSFFFTVTRYVTLCEKRTGPGAIDPYTIPDGSVKALSEMSEEERAIFHPRAELARLIAAKLLELGY